MTDTLHDLDIGELPAGLGGAKPVQLPGTKYQQGRRIQFHVALPVAELARIVQRPDPTRALCPGTERWTKSEPRNSPSTS